MVVLEQRGLPTVVAAAAVRLIQQEPMVLVVLVLLLFVTPAQFNISLVAQ
jgi:hypothetical protein